MAANRRCEAFTFLAGLVFLQQQVAEALFEAVDDLQDGMFGQIGCQADFLLGFEIVAVAAHEAEQAAVLAGDRIDLPPGGQKMLIDEADDVEAVGDDTGVGEVLLHQSAIGDREIHAHHTHVLFGLQTLKIGFQSGFGAAQDHIIDFVVLQVAEGGGIALAPGEKVLVDAEDARATRRAQFGELALEGAPEVTLDGGGAERLAPAQPAAVDAVEVVAKDHLLEGFAGALPEENTREALAEVASASPATELGALQFQDAAAHPHVLVPHPAHIPAFVSQGGALTVRASDRPGIAGR
jgi:hypothetical protein